MATDYAGWLEEVRRHLADLTGKSMGLDDFNYSWIEAWLSSKSPVDAALDATAVRIVQQTRGAYYIRRKTSC